MGLLPEAKHIPFAPTLKVLLPKRHTRTASCTSGSSDWAAGTNPAGATDVH